MIIRGTPYDRGTITPPAVLNTSDLYSRPTPGRYRGRVCRNSLTITTITGATVLRDNDTSAGNPEREESEG